MDALPRPRILLVDDDARSSRLLARMLREDGFDVELVLDGAVAIGRLSREPPCDVLVTDVRLPHVDGVAIARYALSRQSDVPIVFVTSYPELLALDEIGAATAPIVHAKPVDYPRLQRELWEAFERRLRTC